MKKNKKQVGDAFVLLLQFSINMIVPIAAMSLAGWWIGQKTGLSWMMIPFFFIGAIAGGNSIYRLAKKQMGKNEYDYPVRRKKKGNKKDESTEKTE